MNHLLFLDDLELHDVNERKTDSLDNIVKIVTEDMGMSFEIDKYAVFAVKRSKEAQCKGIHLTQPTFQRRINVVSTLWINVELTLIRR